MKPLGGWECLTPWPNKLIQSLIKRRFLSDRIKCALSSQGWLVVTHPPLGNDQALFIESKIRHKISPCVIPEMGDMHLLILKSINHWQGYSQCMNEYIFSFFRFLVFFCPKKVLEAFKSTHRLNTEWGLIIARAVITPYYTHHAKCNGRA